MTRRRLLRAQVALHQRSFWRNPEAAFFDFAMPLGVLLLFGATSGNGPVPGRDDESEAGAGPRLLQLGLDALLEACRLGGERRGCGRQRETEGQGQMHPSPAFRGRGGAQAKLGR